MTDTKFDANDEIQIVKWVERHESVNLVKCAHDLDFQYFEMMEHIQSSEWLAENLSLVLQKIKYDLIDKIINCAKMGELKNAPSVAHVKYITELIDSGIILGGAKKDVGPTPISEDEVSEFEL